MCHCTIQVIPLKYLNIFHGLFSLHCLIPSGSADALSSTYELEDYYSVFSPKYDGKTYTKYDFCLHTRIPHGAHKPIFLSSLLFFSLAIFNIWSDGGVFHSLSLFSETNSRMQYEIIKRHQPAGSTRLTPNWWIVRKKRKLKRVS